MVLEVFKTRLRAGVKGDRLSDGKGSSTTMMTSMMSLNSCFNCNILWDFLSFWLHGFHSQFSYSNFNNLQILFWENPEPRNHSYPVECIEGSGCSLQRGLSFQQVCLTLPLFLGHFSLNGCHLIKEEKHTNQLSSQISLLKNASCLRDTVQ